MPLIITQRDQDLLSCLGIRVRSLTICQCSRGYFDGDDQNSRRRIRALSEAGLVQLRTLLVRQTPIFDAPLFRWSPGDPCPNTARLARHLGQRWGHRQTVSQQIVTLAPKTRQLYGWPGAPASARRPLHASHDLALGEVYLWYLQREPELAQKWYGEDSFTRFRLYPKTRGFAIPDALILKEDQRIERVIELGGYYSQQRLDRLHASFDAREQRYELW